MPYVGGGLLAGLVLGMVLASSGRWCPTGCAGVTMSRTRWASRSG